MLLLIKYRQESGEIDGVFTGTSPEMLEAQRVVDDPTYGYLLTEFEDGLGTFDLIQRYEVHGDALQARQQLTIDADTTVFMADGIDECLVTVEPWQPCTLLVNGEPYALTEPDPILLLTSDVPQRFFITLVPLAGYWAMPLTVEASVDAET